MDIQITGRNKLEITQAIRDHINEKFSKLTHRFQKITSIHISLEVGKKFQHTAEAHIELPPHGDLYAEHTSSDMYTSVNEVVDKIIHQVVKHKEELKDHKDRSQPRGPDYIMADQDKTDPWL